MTTLQLWIVCVTAFAIVVVVAAATRPDGRRSDKSSPPIPTGGTVAVQTVDKRSLRGRLVAVEADRLVLTDASYLIEDDDHPMGGKVSVPIANVALWQEV